MWFASANRKSLLDLIAGIDPFTVLDIKLGNFLKAVFIENKELLLIWQEKPAVNAFQPDMILVEPTKLDDFLAWTSTYLLNLRPFTAFCRVMDYEIVEQVLSTRKKMSLGRIQEPCIGVIIGESITHHDNGELGTITPTSILSTYSFAMARAHALGIMPKGNNIITTRWFNARKLTKQSERVLSAEKMQDIWAVLGLLGMKRVPKKKTIEYSKNILTVFDLCCELADTNSISAKTWQKKMKEFSLLAEFPAQMKEARERRVIWFEKCSNAIREEYGNKQTIGAFLCAFMASQIAPGSMKHVDLLRPFLRTFPSVIVWYGLCAGLYSKTMVYDYDYGLGRRILRDLLRWDPIYGKPMSDIGLDELQVLSKAERSEMRIRPMSHMHLTVEIAPGVMTAVAWPPHSNNKQLAEKTKKEKKDEILKDPLNQLGQLLNKATVIYNDLVKTKKDDQSIAKKYVSKKKLKVQKGRRVTPRTLLDLAEEK